MLQIQDIQFLCAFITAAPSSAMPVFSSPETPVQTVNLQPPARVREGDLGALTASAMDF